MDTVLQLSKPRRSMVEGFALIAHEMEHPRRLTRRRQVRDRIRRNRRRRELFRSFSHKKEREFDLSYRSIKNRSEYFGWDGWPISMRTWLWLSQESRFDGGRRGSKHVALTKALDDPETWVSTVWLGLNHGYFDSDILIFETMIFGGPLNQDYSVRYATVEEARAGHERAIEVARKGVMPEDEAVAEFVEQTAFVPHVHNPVAELAMEVQLREQDVRSIAGLDRDDDE